MEATTFTYSGGTGASSRRVAAILATGIRELREATERPELQAQTAITFLTFAASAEPLTVLELMDRVGYERSSASRNVDLLAEGAAGRGDGLGLVQKATDPFDARKRIVRLSKKGEAVMRRIELKVAPLIQALVRSEAHRTTEPEEQ